ncbi:MAG: RodZ domain-containing protein [Geminicoccaceae bacterium]
MAHERDALGSQPYEGLRRLGAELREARLARGEDVAHAASWLRIRPCFLIALEKGELTGLPGRIYARGFLQSYGEHLGLRGSALAARFDEALGLGIGFRPPQRPLSTGRYLPDATAVAAILLLGAVGAGVYQLLAAGGASPLRSFADLSYSDGARAAEPAQPSALVSVDAELSSRALPSSAVAGRVILVGRSPGWVRLTDATGDFVRSWTVAPGDWIPVPPHRGLALSTGDAGSVEILVDGRSIGTAGPDAAVVRSLPLDPDVLLARMPAS